MAKKTTEITIEQMKAALVSWVDLNELILKLNEEQVIELLGLAKSAGSCKTFLKRIHSRLNKLRAARERKELGRG